MGSGIMENNNNNYDYEDMETITKNVIKIMLRGKVPMEDIMHISGKTEEEINEIAKLED